MRSRIKLLALMNIAEKRFPQEGRIMLTLAGRPYELRVSTLPTIHRAAITIFTGTPAWKSGGRQLILGLAAAAVTFGLGRLIGMAITG